MKTYIVPVKDKDGKALRIPMPLSAGGGDLPAAGGWIDNDRWVARRVRDGDVTDETKTQLAAMAALEAKTLAAQQAAEAAAAKAANAPANIGAATGNATTNASATKGS